MSFASDHALEQRTPIVSHHDTSKLFEAIPENNCVFGFTEHRRMAAMGLWKISRHQAQQHLCTSMQKMKFFTSSKGL